ncbi:MAG: TerB family tellurite resistance protein [Myxococcales bacterium]|nr:TerB family tellurite resistance protein [Myxococcales bacterium]
MRHDELSPNAKLQLIQLACIAAWSDTTVSPEERRVVLDLCHDLSNTSSCPAEVQQWLDGPPPYLDPQEIPHAHRQVFLDTMREVIAADGRVLADESETLRILEELLA